MKKYVCMILALLAVISSFAVFEKNAEITEQIPPGETIRLTGRIFEKEEKSDYQILYLKNISITYQDKSITQSRMIIYDRHLNREHELGNTVSIKGNIQFFETERNPGNFNQKFYYQKQNIYASLWADEIVVKDDSSFGLRERLGRQRIVWKDRILNSVGEKYGGVLCAMLLADKSHMDPEVKELYQLNGIAHILAISGLHLSIIGHGFYQLVRRSSGSYLIGGMVGLAFMSLYILMIGISISALRAVVMFVLRVGADMSGRVYHRGIAVFVAAVAVIMWRPLAVADAGFQLSFGAIVGVLFLNPLIQNCLLKGKQNFLLQSFMANVSITLITLPILLYHYYEFPMYSVLLNFIVVPLMGILLVLAVCIALFGEVSPCIVLCKVILQGYERLCEHFLEFPMARVITGRPEWQGVILYYLGLIMVVILLLKTGKAAKKRVLLGLVPGICILLLCCPWGMQREFSLTMLDVGQGDCIFLHRKKLACLIDGGSSSEKDVGKYRIEPFLKAKGIQELDYVFVSHGDEDHINGIRELLVRQKQGVKINCLVMPDKIVWDESILELAREAARQQVKVAVMRAGDSIIENGMKVTCLYPEMNENNLEIGNETSMVLEVSYREWDMLLTGDVEKEGESILTEKLDKSYEIVKIGHHGSNSSSSEEFLEVIDPGIGLISCGKENPYGHPHSEVLERLKKRGAAVYRTDLSGAITVVIAGKNSSQAVIFPV